MSTTNSSIPSVDAQAEELAHKLVQMAGEKFNLTPEQQEEFRNSDQVRKQEQALKEQFKEAANMQDEIKKTEKQPIINTDALKERKEELIMKLKELEGKIEVSIKDVYAVTAAYSKEKTRTVVGNSAIYSGKGMTAIGTGLVTIGTMMENKGAALQAWGTMHLENKVQTSEERKAQKDELVAKIVASCRKK